jgi:MFS family permease
MVDLEPLRVARPADARAGNRVRLGTQAALVALPYQLYIETTRPSSGLLGAVELVPLVTMALLGGAIADRTDRRRVLLLDQIALVACASALAALAFVSSPPLWTLWCWAGCWRFGRAERRAPRSFRTSSSPRACARRWRSTSASTS